MALEYVLQLNDPCPIQDELEPEELCQVSKFRDMISYIDANKEQFLSRNPDKTEDDIPVTHKVRRGGEEGEEENSVLTFGDIKKQWAHYQSIAGECCPDCPLNFRKREVGCYGAINYPITPECEQWVIDNYNPPEDQPDVIAELIEEHELDGSHLDAGRGSGETFPPPIFLADEPKRKSIPHLDSPVSTSMIFDVLMRIGEIKLDLCWSTLMAFGAVTSDPVVIDEINDLIFSLPEDESKKLILHDRYNGMVIQEDGTFGSYTSDYFPLSFMKEERMDRFEELLGKLKFNLEAPETDDRPTHGFKQFLLANLIAMLYNSVIYTDG